jgi:hypothetical protein
MHCKDRCKLGTSELWGDIQDPIVIAAMFSTIVGMANSLMAQLGDPNSATKIGSLGVLRGLLNTSGVQGVGRGAYLRGRRSGGGETGSDRRSRDGW